MLSRYWFAATITIILAPQAVAQQMYQTSFPGPALPDEMMSSVTAGFRIEVDGECTFVKDQGTTSGGARVWLCRWVDGDFSTTIHGDRSAGASTGSSGLIVWYPGQSFVDIFFVQGGAIVANIFPGGAGARQTFTTVAVVDFRIRREGERVTLEFDDGSGWQTVHTHAAPALLGPVRAGFFFIEEARLPAAATFVYDDFALEADVLAECYADCDCSVSLDFFDFLCFQNAFAASDPYGDCDGTGSLDFFDFLCFQNGFAAGCL